MSGLARFSTVSSVLIGLALAASACAGPRAAAPAAPAAPPSAHGAHAEAPPPTWSYPDVEGGVNRWAGLGECASEGPQSPISFAGQPTTAQSVAVSVEVPTMHVAPHNHAVDFVYPTHGSLAPVITVGGVAYTVAGLHLHDPVEHDVGQPADVEMHIKTTAPDGSVAVFGVLYVLADPAPDAWSAALGDALTTLAAGGVVNLGSTLGAFAHRPFFAYRGSLTTPDCTGGVQWYVLRDPVPLDRTEWATLRTALVDPVHGMVAGNHRSLQPVRGPIFLETPEDTSEASLHSEE